MERIMEYVYEVNNEIIRTYNLMNNDGKLYLRKISNFYLSLRGESTIYDLRNRGYIEMSEAREKYNVDSFEKRDNEKVKTKKYSLKKLAKRR